MTMLGSSSESTGLGPCRYELDPLVFGEARIILTDGINVVHFWVYESHRAALEAWDKWLGAAGEPAGYLRSDRHDPRTDP